jgi:hypothetical protein
MAKKIISIILGPNCDGEAIAIRSTLEYFGFTVVVRLVGRPNDFINILQGDKITNLSEFLIFCFHGQNGKFIMPKLATKIYEPTEPKGNFDCKQIKKFAKFRRQHILVTGCTLGNRKLADCFLKANAKSYTGARNYPEANSVLAFVTTLFYHISQGDHVSDAFEKSKKIDNETQMFEKYNSFSFQSG